MIASTSNLSDALHYANLGWPVFPLSSGIGLRDATTSKATIRGWWRKWPAAQVCLVTGRASGIIVIEVQGELGEASLAAMQAAVSASTPTIIYPGGRLLMFSIPAGAPIPSQRMAPGLVLHGDGGSLVLPRWEPKGWLQ